jgi:hypothetical protein
MPAPDDQVIRFIDKHTPSLDRIERIRAVGLMLDMDGDEQGARDVQSIVDTFTALRQLRGKPVAHALGGMDRAGV